MRVRTSVKPRGFALMLVLIIIMVLVVLAAGFALSMKVETRLAGNAKDEAEFQWLGRSGVELARFVLSESFRQNKPAALNQFWAGGPGDLLETNSPLASINLAENQLGEGIVSIQIVDQERKANINRADRMVLNRAIEIVGLNVTDAATLLDSLEDWIDLDDAPHLSGTESDYYLGLNPPYYAKNGLIDDISELLLVNGMTPELFWGPRAIAHQDQLYRPQPQRGLGADQAILARVGFVDLFTAVSSGAININTASKEVLQLLPGVDEVVAQNIIRVRAGPDGMDGTEDDTPFQSLAMLSPAMVPGILPELAVEMQRLRLADVRSLTFHVMVEVQLGRVQRHFNAIVGLRGAAGAEVLHFSWE